MISTKILITVTILISSSKKAFQLKLLFPKRTNAINLFRQYPGQEALIGA
ncbi:hypothetical protein M3181_18345 [Mesobacillus maritimus]|nr:hypothetical protein [Mesobacillus maritimus]MCM3670924.1 hypothetical protein [Mesobacillus maritimus]